jgi:RNA polymerase sigma-70 factor (ECF subfamily)
LDLLEKELLNKLRYGDGSAFELVFKKYYKSLLRYAEVLARNKAFAEETVARVFTVLWEKRADISIERSLKAYLFRSVYYACLNFHKHRLAIDRYQAYFHYHLDLAQPGQSEETDNFPLAELLHHELEEIIQKGLAQLPEKCRQIFTLSRFDQLENESIAEKLGISVNTVRAQLTIARNKLKSFIEGYYSN